MTTFTNTTPTAPVSFDVLRAKIEPHFLYYAKRHARRMGRWVEIDDVMQDLTGFALEFYTSLILRCKEVFYTPIMQYAIKRYREGRRFIGSNTTDILSHQTQILGRSKLHQLSVFDDEQKTQNLDTREFMEDRRVGVADTVQFKIDYETWIASLPPRDQAIARDLSYGYTTGEVAKKYGVSDGLISQYRKRYEKSWNDFIADKRA